MVRTFIFSDYSSFEEAEAEIQKFREEEDIHIAGEYPIERDEVIGIDIIYVEEAK